MPPLVGAGDAFSDKGEGNSGPAPPPERGEPGDDNSLGGEDGMGASRSISSSAASFFCSRCILSSNSFSLANCRAASRRRFSPISIKADRKAFDFKNAGKEPANNSWCVFCMTSSKALKLGSPLSMALRIFVRSNPSSDTSRLALGMMNLL